MSDWKFCDWETDTSGAFRRVRVSDAGGWVYAFRGSEGASNHVFVPDMETWVNAIAASLTPNAPVSVALDFADTTHSTQPVPDKESI